MATALTAAKSAHPPLWARWNHTSLSHGDWFERYGDRVLTQPSTVISWFGLNPGEFGAVGEGLAQSSVSYGLNWFWA